MSEINELKNKIQNAINNINELFSGFDDEKKYRTFLFLDWNPLHYQRDTSECRFWRECINLYQLFHECMPGFWKFDLIFEDDKKTVVDIYNSFYKPLGYSDEEFKEYRYFCNNLRNIRLYWCHAFMDLTEHQKRMTNIRKFLRYQLKLNLIKEQQNFKMVNLTFEEVDKWNEACICLYNEALRHINLLEEKIRMFNFVDNPELIQTWKLWYSNWYESKDMRQDYIKSALYLFNEFCKENHCVPASFDYEQLKDLKKFPMEPNQYLKMFDNAKDFHPFALSYDIVVHKYGEKGRSYVL